MDFIKTPDFTFFAKSRLKTIEDFGAYNMFISTNQMTAADVAGSKRHIRCLKQFLEYFYSEQIPKIRNAFNTPDLKNKLQGFNFNSNQSKNIDFNMPKVKPLLVQIAHSDSSTFTKQQKAYWNLCYWSIFVGILAKNSNEENIGISNQFKKMVRQFIYSFIVDLGVSPFAKAFKGKNLL